MTRTPSPVKERASSPAFVSRVSPTVSSLPMLSSSAVRIGGFRRCHDSQRSARDAAWPADSGGAAIIESDPRARTGPGARPWTIERDPTSRHRREPPSAAAAAARPPPGRPCAALAAAGSARPDRGDPRCRHGAGPGPRRPRQGRSRRDRRRSRPGRGARRAGDRPGHLRRLPAVIGTSLWLGEWLLGSMGWGVLHGVLLSSSVAMAAVLRRASACGRRIGGAPRVSIVVARPGRRRPRPEPAEPALRRDRRRTRPGRRPGHPPAGRRHAPRRHRRPDRRDRGGRPDERLGRRSLRGTGRFDRARRRTRGVHRHHLRAAGRRGHRHHRSAISRGWR